VNYLLEHFKAFDKLRNESAPFIGEMIWNFADFATPEGKLGEIPRSYTHKTILNI